MVQTTQIQAFDNKEQMRPNKVFAKNRIINNYTLNILAISFVILFVWEQFHLYFSL